VTVSVAGPEADNFVPGASGIRIFAVADRTREDRVATANVRLITFPDTGSLYGDVTCNVVLPALICIPCANVICVTMARHLAGTS
jgi:hypothetical protein